MKKQFTVGPGGRKKIDIKASRTYNAKSMKRKKIMASLADNSMYCKIFLTNLGKYNESNLVGEWVDLPVNDNFESVFKKIGIDKQHEEWFISDYETNILGLEIGEYENIFDLNDKIAQLDELDEDQVLGVSAYLEYGSDLDEAIEHCDDISVYYDCNDMTDVAYQAVDMLGGVMEMPKETLEQHFDYELYGSTMDINGQFVFLDDGICVELLNY